MRSVGHIAVSMTTWPPAGGMLAMAKTTKTA
jgi:hypothetical protein